MARIHVFANQDSSAPIAKISIRADRSPVSMVEHARRTRTTPSGNANALIPTQVRRTSQSYGDIHRREQF